jgi:hypothetical protein
VTLRANRGSRAWRHASVHTRDRRWLDGAPLPQGIDNLHLRAKVAADLEQLRILGNYLIFKAKIRIPDDDLRKAIDDHVEKLTGDRTALHALQHSIGSKRGA